MLGGHRDGLFGCRGDQRRHEDAEWESPDIARVPQPAAGAGSLRVSRADVWRALDLVSDAGEVSASGVDAVTSERACPCRVLVMEDLAGASQSRFSFPNPSRFGGLYEGRN